VAITASPTSATTTAHKTEALVPPTGATAARTRLTVQYWTVTMNDQDSCGSCDATLAALREAVDQVRPLAGRLGITIDIDERAVASWAQALDHAIVASPTIRAAGQELRPTHPDRTERRVWHWRGTSAVLPAEALIDLLVRALAARGQQVDDYLTGGGPAPYLRQYLPTAQPATPTWVGQSRLVESCGVASQVVES
jgi:uncharacterized protein DUF2703